MKGLSKADNKGFTLIEVITALIIGAIFGAIIFQYLGPALRSSAEPLINLGKSEALERALDNMILYFEDRKSRGTLDMAAFRSSIGSAGSDMANQYGKYTVVENRYIDFDSPPTESVDSLGTGTDNILKVTIKNDIEQTATMLFIN